MRADSTLKILLLITAIFLGMMALRPLFAPQAVQAQSADGYPFLSSPDTPRCAPDGSRQVTNKMVVDLSNGDIWGFPTLTSSPYPIDTTVSTPPTSRPHVPGQVRFHTDSLVAIAMTQRLC